MHPVSLPNRRPLRFTPTPVGNARVALVEDKQGAVHPHACGECRICLARTSITVGSPPRLWGMQARVNRRQDFGRFTPTPVGNAAFALTGAGVLTVHPHACGECARLMRICEGLNGSPPRLWGMHREGGVAAGHGRFTPTPVGNAENLHFVNRPSPVHPHACGECGRITNVGIEAIGSPPRLWGMHLITGW